MKTQIFSLMLSAAIFTTNPLFGMDLEYTPEKIGIVHRFTEINEIDSKGPFSLLGNDITMEILSNHLVPNDISMRDVTLPRIFNLSMTSKAMYNFLYSPELWNGIAKKQNITIDNNSILSIKNQVTEYLDRLYFNNLFINTNKSYVIKISELQSIKNTNNCYHQENDPGIDPPDSFDRYNFIIGERSFTLMIARGSRVLDTLPSHSYKTFGGHTPYFDLGFVATLKKEPYYIIPK